MNWTFPWNTKPLLPGALGIALLGLTFNAAASGQSVVDFRKAVQIVEPSLYTVVVTAKDQPQPDDTAIEAQPDAGNAKADEDAEDQQPKRLGRVRVEMFDMQGRPVNGQGNRAQAGAAWGNQWPQAFRQRAAPAAVVDTSTTGFAIDDAMLIAYLGQPAKTVNVEAADGKSSEGNVIAFDYVTGLAAIEVPNGLFTSVVVSSAQTQPGLPVVASWLIDRDLRTDAGMISSRPLPSENGIGMTPQIDFGGSSAAPGAPVVDSDGVVQGVMIPDGSSQLAMLSASQINRLIRSANEDVPNDLKRGLVGIQFQGGGPLVAEVADDSGAAEAGIKAGDMVTQVANIDIKSASDVVASVAEFRAGDTVEFTVKRAGETVLVPVKLGEHPQQLVAQIGTNGFNNAVRQAFQLKDGQLVPMEVDPNAPMPAFPPQAPWGGMDPRMRELLKPFNVPIPPANQPWQGAPIEGFEVERSNLEEALQQMQKQMEKLNKKLDQIN